MQKMLMLVGVIFCSVICPASGMMRYDKYAREKKKGRVTSSKLQFVKTSKRSALTPKFELRRKIERAVREQVAALNMVAEKFGIKKGREQIKYRSLVTKRATYKLSLDKPASNYEMVKGLFDIAFETAKEMHKKKLRKAINEFFEIVNQAV